MRMTMMMDAAMRAMTNTMLRLFNKVTPRLRLEVGERFILDTTTAGIALQVPWRGGKQAGMFWCGWGSALNAYDRPRFAKTSRSVWDEEAEDFRHEMRDDTGAWKPAVQCGETWRVVLADGVRDDMGACGPAQAA